MSSAELTIAIGSRFVEEQTQTSGCRFTMRTDKYAINIQASQYMDKKKNSYF